MENKKIEIIWESILEEVLGMKNQKELQELKLKM
jgi:hypothetical protein